MRSPKGLTAPAHSIARRWLGRPITVSSDADRFHGLGAASEPYSGGAERDGRWLLKAIEDNRPENGDQDRRDAARDEAGHCCPL